MRIEREYEENLPSGNKASRKMKAFRNIRNEFDVALKIIRKENVCEVEMSRIKTTTFVSPYSSHFPLLTFSKETLILFHSP
jgi:hypothetical protein